MKRQLVIGIMTACMLCIVIKAQSSSQRIHPNFGGIDGYVLDAEGKAVSEAKVLAEVLDHPVPSRLPSTYTDEKGRFSLNNLPPGRYSIHALKESAGYPNTISAFFSFDHEALRRVIVHEQQVTKDVVIKLGPKAATIVGRIVDSRTGEPVENAQLILCRQVNPDICYSTTTNKPESHFKLLVPPVPFTIRVSATGYEDWYYKNEDSKEQADAIRLASNTTKELDISLRPVK